MKIILTFVHTKHKMKKLVLILLTLTLTNIFGQTTNEIEMFKLINQVRTAPKTFIPVVEAQIKKLEDLKNGKQIKFNSKITVINTKHTYSPKLDTLILEAKDLIKFLNSIKPVNALTISNVMYSTTKTFSNFLDSKKEIGHTGINDQTFAKRIQTVGLTGGENCTVGLDANEAMYLLLVDYGKEKGHRNNLFNVNYKQVSVANTGNVWVQDFINEK
jgi:hypothetical protein